MTAIKRLLIHQYLLFPLGLMLLIFSWRIACINGDPTWFSRSGGIFAVFGGILSMRRILVLGPDKFYQDQCDLNMGNLVRTPEELSEARGKLTDTRAFYIGSLMVLVGVVINSYGDKFNFLFPPK